MNNTIHPGDEVLWRVPEVNNLPLYYSPEILMKFGGRMLTGIVMTNVHKPAMPGVYHDYVGVYFEDLNNYNLGITLRGECNVEWMDTPARSGCLWVPLESLSLFERFHADEAFIASSLESILNFRYCQEELQ